MDNDEPKLRNMINMAIAELHNTGVIKRILNKHQKFADHFYRIKDPYIRPEATDSQHSAAN